MKKYIYIILFTFGVQIIANAIFSQEQNESNTVEAPDTEFDIPSSFTPNGDGKNDTWSFSFEGYNKAIIVVYSRWGNKVYKSTDLEINWNGKSDKGEDLPSGSYYYVLELNGGDISQNGNVTILR